MRNSHILLVMVLILDAIGCDERQQPANLRRPSSTSTKPQQRSSPETPIVPNEVQYSIIDSSIVPGIKRSLDVRLSRKIPERALRALAIKLKSQDSSNYNRTFIAYYLPNMKVGAGAWATTHFNPDLEIRILRLTAEQEDALKQQPDDPSREVIGSWIDDTMFGGNRTTIFKRDGRLFLENVYKDGSSGEKEIVAMYSGNDKKFEDKTVNSFGEFYLIDSQGNLQFWDQDGLISTAKKIDN